MFYRDFVSYIPLGIIFVILIVSFPKTESLSGLQGQLAAFIVLLLSFGFAITSFTYMISFLFKTPSGAQIACILINFIIGVGLSSVGFILRVNNATRNLFLTKLRYLFCLLPTFADSLTWDCATYTILWNWAATKNTEPSIGRLLEPISAL